MKKENNQTVDTQTVLDNLTRTLLYEGYSLFPYHRSAIKNQKPVPFGVVYPRIYNLYNPQVAAEMQSQCILTGGENVSLHIIIRFLHLLNPAEKGNKLSAKGWQTIERKIDAGNLPVADLIVADKDIPFLFSKTDDDFHDSNKETGYEIFPIRGHVVIKAERVENIENAFRISVNIINTSLMSEGKLLSRDEALQQSLLSTHIILSAPAGEFISSQAPPAHFREAITECKNTGTWAILVTEDNSTIISSPIIVSDYPKIHPQSKGDLFDSTEIEEALMLHFAAMSDEEKNSIAESDPKLRAMLKRAGEITPEELITLHGGMHENN